MTRIELDAALVEAEHNSKVLNRNYIQLPRDSHIGKHLEDFTDSLLFSKGEVFVEFKRQLESIKKRVEGFVVQFSEDGPFKTIGLWCTKNHELLTITFGPTDECRVGDVDNAEHHEVESTCFDCREELVDCRCHAF